MKKKIVLNMWIAHVAYPNLGKEICTNSCVFPPSLLLNFSLFDPVRSPHRPTATHSRPFFSSL